LEKALDHELSGVFLLTGNIATIKRYVDFYKSNHLFVFLHLEKIGGLLPDKEGLSFIANYVKPTGIISTKKSHIKEVKKLGLLTIQRLFLVDSDALTHGISSFQEGIPDAIELMPGLIPEIVTQVKRLTDIPIITGGLIQNREQMIKAVNSGAVAVSTGNPDLWGVNITSEKV